MYLLGWDGLICLDSLPLGHASFTLLQFIVSNTRLTVNNARPAMGYTVNLQHGSLFESM